MKFKEIAAVGLILLLALGLAFVGGKRYQLSRKALGHYYDRILVQGDRPQEDFLLVLELSRVEQALTGKYSHFYDARLWWRGQVYRRRDAFSSLSHEIQTGKLFSQIASRSEKESTQERVDLTFHMDQKTIHLVLTGLESDFIVKNRLEYLRFLSVGQARLTLDEKTFAGQAVVDKVASTDVSESSAQGMDHIRRTNHSLMLWDEAHNFYGIDQSIVPTPNPRYPPHCWVLLKDHAKGSLRKGFKANVQVNKDPLGTPTLWKIEIPYLDGPKLTLKFVGELSRAGDVTGRVAGEVQDGRGIRKVVGYGSYDDIF